MLRKSIGVKWGFVCVWSLYTQKHPRTGVLMGAWRFDATVDEKLHESLWLDHASDRSAPEDRARPVGVNRMAGTQEHRPLSPHRPPELGILP